MKFQNKSIINYPHKTVIDWHMRSGALIRLNPPFEPIKGEQPAKGASNGLISNFKIGAGPFFQWKHHHQFIDQNVSTLILDDIEWSGPIFKFLTPFFKNKINKILEVNFKYRERRLNHDLARHEKYHHQPRIKIGITGASGVIGSALSAFLSTGGHDVYHFVRRAPNHEKEIFWDPKNNEIDIDQTKILDAVVHLAGENVAGRKWTNQFKKTIFDSRTQGTKLITKTLSLLNDKPRHLISASAIGIYSGGFLGEVCEAWEKSSIPSIENPNLKISITRIGVVLTSKGGALKELTIPTLFGLGGKIGSGKQKMSWISLDDAVSAIHEILFNKDADEKIYDLVSPTPIEQKLLSKEISNVLRRPNFFNIPSVLVKLIFGQMGKEVLLTGQEVYPKSLHKLGFKFEFTNLEDLLRFELGKIK